MTIYEAGDAIPLSWAISVSGTPTNATVVLTVYRPDGTEDTPSLSNPSTGSYVTTYTPTISGSYGYRWVATGAVTATDTGSFEVGTVYGTLALLKSKLSISGSGDDELLTNALIAASRAVDLYTGTTFYPVVEDRYFYADNCSEVYVDPFVDATGLAVSIGTDSTTWTPLGSGYLVPWPPNPSNSRPHDRILTQGGQFPVSTYYVHPTVKVNARWGYPSPPHDVIEATLIKAAHLYRRKDSPEGLAGSSDMGLVRISRFEDPDYERLLAPYVTKVAFA